jgi:hypothetical protein
MQAQESRSRSSNAEANHEKLFDELQRMYADAIPGESKAEKQAKHEAVSVAKPFGPNHSPDESVV